MTDDFVRTVIERFRVAPRDSQALLESRSGAGVHEVRTLAGHPAYLKVAMDRRALDGARRELRFYVELAPNVPVRTPRLLDHVDDDRGIALLLEAAGSTVPSPMWTEAMWRALGRDLARLHAVPLPTGAGWDRPDSLRDALANPDTAQLRAFWSPTLARFDQILAGRAALWDQMQALPPVFSHGDCHTENLPLQPRAGDGPAGGSLVFCDWQVAGVGRPGSDLALLSVRAAPHGVVVPPVLVDAYLEQRPGDRNTLQRALLAEELSILVFQWSPYAAFNSEAGTDRVRRRTRDLALQWLDRRDRPDGEVRSGPTKLD
jgi:hypothetical protein